MPVVIIAESSPLELIESGAAQAITFMSTAFSTMTGNVYLAVFLGVTMIGAGVTLFRKLRKGA